jgi:hypothetical protein
MADPQGLLSKLAQGFSDATQGKGDESSDGHTCPTCGQPTAQAAPADEPMSKKIKRGLGLPDDGAAF